MNDRTIELDISKEGAGTFVRVAQGDDGGTTIKALIYDNGAELSLAGAAVWLVVLLPNKRNYYRGQCTVSGNAATHVVDESKLCSVPGYTDEAYFTVTKDGNTYSTERFAIEILRSALDGQKPAQNWDAAVDDLIARGDAAVSAANAAASSANAAAKRANDGADTVNAAKENANKAATAANNAASAANTAKANADKATTAANNAASAANTAKANADKATTAANNAASSANTAASSARAAAATANGAADDATAAAQNALNIANAIAAIEPPSDDEVQELRDENATLATALVELQDGYIVLGEIAYMPTNRRSALSGETLTVAQATMSGETATLN
ncbi:BppU family phage baseplate upper protein [Collinsella ihumii]|uniref:BppU family phage baseplate upper protein n=1 Tax=Collinsella ihumii TaxID=1720204 RepID=A0ABT7XHJ0_9ACTN|nr:BppU family phage baseplate upper protein [Collinsella ihumii]MDN0064884.1 BppU family phage baseplate upper protein [Collinsella ihumii]